MNSARGFSMLEVLIAVTLIVIGAGAMFNGFYASQHFITPGPHTAVRLIASKAAELREYVRADSVSQLDPNATYGAENTQLGGTTYILNRSVSNATGGVPSRDYKYSTITMTWESQD